MKFARVKESWSNMPSLIDLMIVVAVLSIVGFESVVIIAGLTLVIITSYFILKALLWGVRLLHAVFVRRPS